MKNIPKYFRILQTEKSKCYIPECLLTDCINAVYFEIWLFSCSLSACQTLRGSMKPRKSNTAGFNDMLNFLREMIRYDQSWAVASY